MNYLNDPYIISFISGVIIFVLLFSHDKYVKKCEEFRLKKYLIGFIAGSSSVFVSLYFMNNTETNVLEPFDT